MATTFDPPAYAINDFAGYPKGWKLVVGKVHRRRTYFIYSTQKDWGRYSITLVQGVDARLSDEKPFFAATVRQDNYRGYTVIKGTAFKTRAAAKRSAYRSYKAYVKKLANQKAKRDAGYVPPGQRCNQCEERRKVKGDYLCHDCRWGWPD